MGIDEFIETWWGKKGGAERSNFSAFIPDLCEALGLPRPQAAEAGKLGDYEYEGTVKGGSFRSLKASGSIDLYKKHSFVMEAKQSQLTKEQQKTPDLFDPEETAPKAPSGARYDKLMLDARRQAENYAKNLPADHPSVPFLIVCDVGRAFELYYDWSGNGRGYGFFPDKQSYRIELPQLASDAEIGPSKKSAADLLRAIWLEPATVDPRLRSAEVTRAVARRLADVSKWLEEVQRLKMAGKSSAERSAAVEESALFLMRILFCMFAEDIDLLPKGKFKAFLERAIENDKLFENGLSDLWLKMGAANIAPRFAHAVEDEVRYFNGGLFASNSTKSLDRSSIGELFAASKADWKNVEPAIFGTLLEQALTPEERAKLGAHYTPRPYVERLVQATVMEVLEGEWEQVEAIADRDAKLAAATTFHDRIAALRILDPACGTGNFLYVAMELLQRLESDVIERIEQLGGDARQRVGPHQFYGLELNPRAAKIAELVLWIGWLRNRLHDDPDAVPQPVLAESANINFGRHGGYDAVLRLKDTGEADLDNPLLAAWPEADFIVGNPPFIGGKDIRKRLGGDYAEAMWKANGRVPKSADFVMQWWDRAAHLLIAPDSPLIRFGFVTTNSITQTFSRRVIENYLSDLTNDDESMVPKNKKAVATKSGTKKSARPPTSSPAKGGGSAPALTEGALASDEATPLHHPADGPPPLAGEDIGDTTRPAQKADKPKASKLSLIMAIGDHPWTKATKDAAAVRIAMTVAASGAHDGRLIEVTSEKALETDTPELETSLSLGKINADLTVGSDSGQVTPLKSNYGLGYRGVQLIGSGFIVTAQEAAHLGLGKRDGLERHIRPYRNGRDLLQRSRDVMVIDLFGLDEKQVRQKFPEVYQHLDVTVRTQRAEQVKKSPTNDAKAYLKSWWLHGKPRQELRPALEGLPRYIATVETAKHRIFQFLDTEILPDNKIIVICSADAADIGILNSAIHLHWTYANSGLIGMANFEAGHVYVKSQIFDPFPFPDATADQRAVIAELAEELDETRKAALAEVPGLTMTELYNLRDKLLAVKAKDGGKLSPADEERARAARAGIVNRLHDQIDEAVADAYGWGEEWRAGPLAPATIVARLVALNQERAAEEAQGTIRWLRPDYQIPRFGKISGGEASKTAKHT